MQSYSDELVLVYLNKNSVRHKFEILSYQIKDYTDILMVSLTEINDSFPKLSFLIVTFSTL